MTGLMDAWLLAARIRLHADIDHACALELQRAREHAESARRSIGQLFRWARVEKSPSTLRTRFFNAPAREGAQ